MTADGPPFELPDDDAIDPALMESMRAAVDERLSRERGALASIRAWPTRQRRAVLGFVVGGLTTAAVIGGGGPMAIAIALGVAAMALAWMSLRPLHRPSPPVWAEHLIPVAAVAGVVTLALLASDGTKVGWAQHLRCFGPGMGAAGLTLLVWRLLSRRPSGFHALAGASAAGLSANAFLAGQCAVVSTEHVLFGHVSVLVLLILLAWIADLLRPSRIL